jgi:hypothetical protein
MRKILFLIICFCFINTFAQEPLQNRNKFILHSAINSNFKGFNLTKLKTIDYCQLFDSTNYDEKIIKTTAILFSPAEGEVRVDGSSDEFFYFNTCNGKDYFARADFSQTENLEALDKIWSAKRNNKQPLILKLNLKGKLSLTFIPSFGHLAWLRAEIRVDKILSINMIKSKDILPDFKADTPIIKAGENLKYFNTEFMFSYFGRGLTNSQLENLLTDKTEIIINNKLLGQNEFSGFKKEFEGGDLSIRINDVKKEKSVWRIQGKMTNKLKDKPLIEISYDNLFSLQQDKSWKLVYSKLKY